MSDIMRPVETRDLLNWIVSEYKRSRSIFGIAEGNFFRKVNDRNMTIFGETCDTAVGPAAGPHTQLARNIVAAFLTGGRFFELKTVQKLDRLKIEKPCIYAPFEGYNTEWSSELTLEQAYHEYVKAWLLCHITEAVFGFRTSAGRSFQFNMSVGYDLEGIKTERMDTFIRGMTDAHSRPIFEETRQQLLELSTAPDFGTNTVFAAKKEQIQLLLAHASPRISPSVTLSTMHGCPPSEIKAIAEYLLTEKKLHTFLKLNPTLLGYEQVRRILDRTGFSTVELDQSSFENDLHYDEAVSILAYLNDLARSRGLEFGAKLSNTLPVVNRGTPLPGGEMYLSGKALYPLTITLAAQLANDFGPELSLSFCGGLCQNTVSDVFRSGVRPLTVVTELLKPGGYYRLTEMARAIEENSTDADWQKKVDPAVLSQLAEQAVSDGRKSWSFTRPQKFPLSRELPLFDCFEAPCIHACAIHQDIPDYIRLVGQGRYLEALDLIYSRNPLPCITGTICDHQCMTACTRLDYDGPVQIRHMKLIATEQVSPDYSPCKLQHPDNDKASRARVAIIGAGPAGLALAFYLARNGLRPTVFEKRENAGGIVRHILPSFRISKETIDKDIRAIEQLGVEFQFNVAPDFSVQALQQKGFRYVFIGIGAEESKKLNVLGDTIRQFNALDFLDVFKHSPDKLDCGPFIAVIGGGNTAMDCARAARRLPGVQQVSIIYRRTEADMPADREEYDNALKEGIIFRPLLLPESYSERTGLICRRMLTGPPDESGRPRPLPSHETVHLPVDTVIMAIGETVEHRLLVNANIPLGPNGLPVINPDTLETNVPGVYIGGDAYTGPATVVKALANARTVAEHILGRENISLPPSFHHVVKQGSATENNQYSRITARKGKLLDSVGDLQSREFARREADRCLECHLLCGKCVDVCPNRANVLVKTSDKTIFRDRFQILHLDYCCNECGNCSTFCPFQGQPFKDKWTLFANRDDFLDSDNNGFIINRTCNHVEVEFRFHDQLFSASCGRNDSANIKVNNTSSSLELTPEMKALLKPVLSFIQILI